MSSTVEDLFRTYTKRASEVARQLAFVGLATIWFIHTSTVAAGIDPTNKAIDSIYHSPLILFVICLGIDAAQYLAGSVLWGWLAYSGKSSEPASNFPVAVWVPSLLIGAKLLVLIIAYWELFNVLIEKLI